MSDCLRDNIRHFQQLWSENAIKWALAAVCNNYLTGDKASAAVEDGNIYTLVWDVQNAYDTTDADQSRAAAGGGWHTWWYHRCVRICSPSQLWNTDNKTRVDVICVGVIIVFIQRAPVVPASKLIGCLLRTGLKCTNLCCSDNSVVCFFLVYSITIVSHVAIGCLSCIECFDWPFQIVLRFALQVRPSGEKWLTEAVLTHQNHWHCASIIQLVCWLYFNKSLILLLFQLCVHLYLRNKCKERCML